jgi:competence protein ComEC
LPFLRSQGIAKVDQLIISHGDNDHIGGSESLIQGITVDKILTSVPEKLSVHHAIGCIAGQAWSWDGIDFYILSPAEHLGSENDNSCVLQVKTAHGTALLTGDIEANAEAWLVKNNREQIKAQLLIAPHHGSKTSSTLEFLQAVRPEVVLIPAGYHNQFGHPHSDVLARYQALHANYLSSADSGAIIVDFKNGAKEVSEWRQTNRRYWHNTPN